MVELKVVSEGNHPKQRENLDPQDSNRKGFAGAFETLLRKFKAVFHAFLLFPVYGVASVCLGIAATPGVFLVSFVHRSLEHSSDLVKIPLLAITIAGAYFLYGFSLILVIPLVNRLTVGKLKPWRGAYYSLPVVRWYLHNGLTYLVRYTFLPFITPSPFNIFFYRLMGMKIGKGVQLNTEHISDPSLIEIGDQATIGGSVTMIAHYGMGGLLVIAPLKIGKGAIIGIRATLMAGVEVGERAKVLPNSVVLPNTKIPASETWAGVPAQKIK